MKWISPIVAAVAALTLVGCSRDGDVVGTWRTELSGGDKKDASISLSGPEVTFKSDHTFSFQLFAVDVTGKWSCRGSHVEVTFDKKSDSNGRASLSLNSDKDEPLELELSSDGKTLQTEPDDKSNGKIMLTKQPS